MKRHLSLNKCIAIVIIPLLVLLCGFIGGLFEQLGEILSVLYQKALSPPVMAGAGVGAVVGLIITYLLINDKLGIEASSTEIHKKFEHTIQLLDFGATVVIGTLGLGAGLYLAYEALPVTPIPTINKFKVTIDGTSVDGKVNQEGEVTLIGELPSIPPGDTKTIKVSRVTDSNEITHIDRNDDNRTHDIWCDWNIAYTDKCEIPVTFPRSLEERLITVSFYSTEKEFKDPVRIELNFKIAFQ
jgi:hypothetical protein